MRQEQEPGRKEGPFPRLPVIPLLMALSFLLGQIAERNGIDITSLLSQPQPTTPSSSLGEIPSSEVEQIRLVNQFLSIKTNYENIFEQQLSLSQSKLSEDRQSVQFIQRQGRLHLVDGVNLAKLVLPSEQSAQIEQSGQDIILEGEKFNLNSLYERSLAAAILELRLEYFSSTLREKERLKEEEEERARDIQPDIPDLIWLKNRQINIEIEENSWGYLPTNYLLTLTRTVKALDEADLPIPSKFKFIAYKKGMVGGGWYEGRHDLLNPFSVVVTNNSTPWTITHEVGHFISDAWALPDKDLAARMQAFSQQAFTESVWPNQGKDPNDTNEDYAKAFARYLLEGETFRSRMTRDPQQNKQYKFMQKLFNDSEYAGNAQILVYSKEYQPGLLALINDPDLAHPGILLRPQTDTGLWELTSDLPAVFSGDGVRLLEKMVLPSYRINYIYGGFSRTTDGTTVMWRVEIVNQAHQSQFLVGRLSGQTGWIDQNFLQLIAQGR